ncbi:MAG TPA: DEAD/DEAH box helicase family protein [Chloroflexi bacterium]|jgi:predicted DnaQ family exonuclease/DinG family helicase|nr:DEAD/DEAH box helicase family protein [Chloroflexota bacterium]
MPRTYVALDLEFTGLDAQRDEIIEIGLVRFAGDEVQETFTSLVNSRRPVPYKIQQMSGITQEEVRRAPTLESLRGRVLSFVRSHPVIGHNIEMDLRYLNRQGMPLQNLAIDTFELASILVPEANRYSLSDLANLLGIQLSQSHRALPDAITTKDLFLALLHRTREWDVSLLEEITRLSAGSDWPLLRVFRDILDERRGQDGPAILLGGGRPEPRRFYVPPAEEDSFRLEPTQTIRPVDEDELADMISPGGLIARSFTGYEYREEQVEMLRAVARAFSTPEHLMVEAGTGTGKSLAYLLPAIRFAVQNGRRVVISSNTINLQDQLYSKDVPDLQRILPWEFRAAILKGRSNYLCMRRLSAMRRSRSLSAEEARVLAKVYAWLPTTRTGDRAELLLINSDNDIWQQLQSSSETCMGDLCPFQQSRQCFFYRARSRAERAHLVIVNHALLLSDMVLENRILPEYRYAIVDEAHHLEDQATSQFGFEAGRAAIYAYLAGISSEGGDAPGGVLAQVPVLFQRSNLSATARQALEHSIRDLRAEVDRSQRRLYEMFNTIAAFLQEQSSSSQRPRSMYDETTRITSGLRIQPGWTTVEIAWENFSATMQPLLNGLERLANQIEGLDLGEDAERDELVQEVRAALQRGQEMWMGLDRILMEPDDEGIYWISVARNDEITLHSAPLHVGPLMAERFFMEKDCVILTSATLRTGGSFHFLKNRLQIEEPAEVALESPFDYKTSVLLYVPKDIPEPNQPYYQKTVQQALIDLCRATQGRTLILFTSNSQLQTTYRGIQPALEQDEIVVFGQGLDGSRRQLLDSFRNTPRAVLLGTRSFWEGIDVVGNALSCLVITRLPFAVPTDPVYSARAETFEDPFNEYYLPEAILRFRQGFGRLIRSRDDYGVVVVLDKRILTKAYGKTILRSLPGCTARQGPLESLPAVAQRWLDPDNRK